MRKLKLEIDELTVESFAVDAQPAADAGTVHGRLAPLYPNPDTAGECDGGGGGGGYSEGTCIGPTYCCTPTWRVTCAHTCRNTCAWTCGAWTYCALQCDWYL